MRRTVEPTTTVWRDADGWHARVTYDPIAQAAAQVAIWKMSGMDGPVPAVVQDVDDPQVWHEDRPHPTPRLDALMSESPVWRDA